MKCGRCGEDMIFCECLDPLPQQSGFFRSHAVVIVVAVAVLFVAAVTVMFSMDFAGLANQGGCPPQQIQQITGHYCAGFHVGSGIVPNTGG